MRIISTLMLCLCLGACGRNYEAMMNETPLSPVGSGLAAKETPKIASVYPTSASSEENWIGGSADYFRDRRPRHVGDLLTVDIAIDDKASLNSTSNQSRKANVNGGYKFNYDVMGVVKSDLNGKGDINSNTSQMGQGSTARAEKIELAVAAVVTEVLPNGNLVIKGTQEIKVNSETRILSISGIVLPRDISGRGRVAYDRIAEARISYGGKGTINDVQKPGWGQRLWNKIAPM